MKSPSIELPTMAINDAERTFIGGVSERVAQLPEPKQRPVIDVIEALLAQKGHQGREAR